MNNARTIDWQTVRGRLARSQKATAAAQNFDAVRIEKALDVRAAAFAARGARQRAETLALTVQTFLLGDQSFAIEIRRIREIVPFRHCTPVPGAPENIRGIINLRGEIRTVIDLARILGLPSAPEALGYVLLVRGEEHETGLRVDQLGPVKQIDESELVRPTSGRTDLVRALAGERLALLDLDAILSRIEFSKTSPK